jgi:DNA-binding transcriptional LysR family regulator
MTYDQLLAFAAVVAEGGFHAASAALHKSQPAVSNLVRNLEEEIGVPLFDRNQYRATLTDAGRLFHQRVAAVIDSTNSLRSFGLALAGRTETTVRLAIEPITPLLPVAGVLRALQQRYPAVRFELDTEKLGGAGDALRADRADIAIATTPGLSTKRLEARRHGAVRIVAVARAGHPVATAPAAERASALRMHPQIVLRDAAADPMAPSINVLEDGLVWRVTEVAAKRDLILAGMGWGGLPEHVVAAELERGTMVELEIPEFVTTSMELLLLRRRDRPHGIVAQALWDALAAAA